MLCLFTAQTGSQGWTPTGSGGVVYSCLCAGYKARGLEDETHRENVSNDPSRPADARDKRPPWGLAESVSDNCSITRPIGWLVWKSGL